MFLALLPALAQAQCANWDAGGYWDINQRGTTYLIRLKLQQKGRVLTGLAFNDPSGTIPDNPSPAIWYFGRVDGTIDENNFSVQIFWPDGLTGVYTGKVLPSGRIDGETHDKNNSKISETWHSEGVLKCATPINPRVVVQSTAPRPPPLKSTGKMPKSEPAPPMKVPGIVVSPFIFPSPGSPTVFVVITWDAGPDHPYAEVWFKVNNGEGTFLVE